MHSIRAKNITDAFYKTLECMKISGKEMETWKGKVIELSPVLIEVERPKERCLVIPNRYNNIVATIAETIWVIGGRDDLKYLLKYLPRAHEFSDDGSTWRGAYGKRLTNWYGVNQVEEIVNLLKRIPYTGRAVMTLFDPLIDYDNQTKDIPCNNWIQFLLRDGKLNMHVALRANDLIWGFSGINMFEWTVLQEMIAGWLNVEVGKYYHFVGSMNIFEHHFERMDKMLENRIKSDIYHNYPNLNQTKVDIKEDSFQYQIKKFFEVEEGFSNADENSIESILKQVNELQSSFLRQCLKLMLTFLLFKKNEHALAKRVFETSVNDDYKFALADLMCRKIPEVYGPSC
ncbi:Thymidylate synthase [Fontibacillus panacisegetis]|uniref:Thymidylate synthase n=1 Tax=Fontibacillus panacisegetis TaxID=670482 RepID=A0A1G7PZ59_9BACL|nr:thymidylate synthase [Fontibacillus panacisegetis]SDF91546.1 Thymidylate synthase [Fontibacillus panacisegetis]